MIFFGEVWAFIPARGGSKTVPLKNMKILGGLPLIHYSISAAKESEEIARVVCSTDNEIISCYCNERAIEVLERPPELSGDSVPTVTVLLQMLEELEGKHHGLPELIALFEPTSPFVRQQDISQCIQSIRQDKNATSSQTVCEVPPNHHAFNQRFIEDGQWSRFKFIEERKLSFNKQTKQKFYCHGNLRVIRTEALLSTGDIFGARSRAIIIPRKYAMDVDGPEDFELAEIILSSMA